MLNDSSIYREGKPSIYYRVRQMILKRISVKGRKKINQIMEKELGDKSFSIISSFCGGGTLYHDSGMQFLSPTINMAFDGPDFIKFTSDLNRYLSCDFVEFKTDAVSYPVGRLEDVEVRFVHYTSFEVAVKKWKERSKRIDFENIIIMATDRDGMGSPECMSAFDKLPYKKVMFTHKPYPNYSWAVYCPCFKRQQSVGTMTGIADLQGNRYYEKYCDMVAFILSEKV